jgi:septum formation protein
VSSRLVLASSSPRRLALLNQIGVVPDQIIAPEIDETPHKLELPRFAAQRLARAKLAAVDAPGFVLAADTVVALGRRMLPKTETIDEARLCLQRLSGRRHHVLTAIALRAPDGRIAERLVDSAVGFARLEPRAIEDYLATSEWRGKAGGYGIQGRAAVFVDFLAGSYSAVVGLPLHETEKLLRGLGFFRS